MNFDPNTDYKAFIRTFVLRHLPECEILIGNAKTIIHEGETLIDSERLRKGSVKEAFENIDLYGEQLGYAFESAGVQFPTERAGIDIQSGAAIYVIALVAKSYGVSLKGISKRLNDIEKTSRKLKDLLELDTELFAIGGSVTLTEFIGLLRSEATRSVSEDEGQELMDNLFMVRYQALSKELDYFSNIKRNFSESFPAKWVQFGESGPKESSALNIWITNLAEVWHFQLGRSLTFSPNPNEGREKFLSFAETCFEAIHPSLIAERPDAIRNAYEKLRQQGKFDYPPEKTV